MSHDVFVSYSSKDKAVADAVVSALENSGLRCWVAPRDVKPGAEWGDSITNAINACKLVILVFSGHSNQSKRVRDEIYYVISEEKIILPFRIENLDPTGSMRLHLSSRHWLDAYQPSWQAHINRLVGSAADSLGRELVLPAAQEAAPPPVAGAGQLPSQAVTGAGPVPAQPTPVAKQGGRRIWVWIAAGLGLLLILALAGGGVLLAQDGPTLLATPTSTPRPTPLPTRTPNLVATRQVQSTRAAATAQWAWVHDFAQPILDDVHSRKPDFEDDFSDMNGRFARWSYISGDATFTEGVMRINTAGHDGVDAGGSMIATDLVLEFEFIPRIASDGSCACPGFRWNDAGGYSFNINLKDTWRGMLSIPMAQEGRVVAEGDSPEAGLTRSTSVTVIAKDNRFAFYVNGKPLLYAEDSTWNGDFAYISVWSPSGTSEVDFDNVKFWDLNKPQP